MKNRLLQCMCSGNGIAFNLLLTAYDLFNVKIILPKDKEDTALLLGGKKKNFKKSYFDQFGKVLNLNIKQINSVYRKLDVWLPKAIHMIDISFLNETNKQTYKGLINKRVILFISSIIKGVHI